MQASNNQELILSLKQALTFLPVRLKRRLQWLILLAFFTAGVETMAVGSIALFVSSIVSPDSLRDIGLISNAQRFVPSLDWSNPKVIIIVLCCAVIVLSGMRAVFRLLFNTLQVRVATLADAFMGEALLDGFFRMPYEWHCAKNSADLVSLVDWRKFYGSGLLSNVMLFCSDALVMLLMTVALLIMLPPASILAVIGVGGVAALVYRYAKKRIDMAATSRKNVHFSLNRDVTSALHGIKDARAYGLEHRYINLYVRQGDKYSIDSAIMRFFIDIPGIFMELLGVSILVGAALYMLLVLDYSLVKTTGIMTLFAVSAWRIMPAISRSLNQLSNMRNAIPYVRTCLDMLGEIFEKAEYEYIPEKEALSAVEPVDAIRFSKVSFSYTGSGQAVLDGLDIAIPVGASVGIVGASGAGKSTFVDLLLGLLTPSAGSILVDDQSLEGIGRLAWLRSVGYVPQDPYIYDGSLVDNIALGSGEEAIDLQRVEYCCSLAEMDFVSAFENGLDQPLGERGALLSGGQRQRVAIARALYSDPSVLIFDEATSALDQKTEDAVIKTIYGLKEERTLIFIAHRLRTVKRCDFIIWLENGRVRRMGSPDDVLPLYLRLEQNADNLLEKLKPNE